MNNSIVVTPRDAKDYGVYVCHATNRFGSTAYNITLTEPGRKSLTPTDAIKEDESECCPYVTHFKYSKIISLYRGIVISKLPI